ncbi:MAG: hypothetical protein LBO09_08660 [Candidatus Peribacteria bacterium]|jgi:hypothetical protein|nr:hypothetical protein [Candidatus Peribacteria bacterium]
MYCRFEEESLTLYVKKEEGLIKCATYLRSLEQLTRQKYDEVLLTMKYVRQGEDVFYRQEIFAEKKSEFLKLYLYKTKLVEALASFETKFFLLYKTSLTNTLRPYLETLPAIQKKLAQETQKNPNDKRTLSTYQLITQQVEVIQNLLNATTLDEIMEYIPSYLYLKQSLL